MMFACQVAVRQRALATMVRTVACAEGIKKPPTRDWAATHFCAQRRRPFSDSAAATAAKEETASTSDSTANASSSSTSPPPIQWTTHLLTAEQVAKVDKIFHKMLWLDMVEIHLLTELVNERLGVHMTPKQRAMLHREMEAYEMKQYGKGSSSSGADGAGQDAVAEQPAVAKLVELKLTGFDEKAKIKVIKEVRAIAGLGLKDAKELVEAAPKVIKKDLKREDAEELQKKLQEAGAQVEIV